MKKEGTLRRVAQPVLAKKPAPPPKVEEPAAAAAEQQQAAGGEEGMETDAGEAARADSPQESVPMEG